MVRILWTRPAREQLDAVLTPITEEDPEMGVLISKRIKESVMRLAHFPESAPIYQETVRRLTIHNLPYSCYYDFTEGFVRILAIRHDRQRQPGCEP